MGWLDNKEEQNDKEYKKGYEKGLKGYSMFEEACDNLAKSIMTDRERELEEIHQKGITQGKNDRNK